MPYLTYGRLRPLHVNGMLFGWLLAADMGLTYYIVPRLCGVKLWSEKLGVATAALWNVIMLGAVVCAARRLQPGPGIRRTAAAARRPGGDRVDHVRRQYLRAPSRTRKYQQMYVSLWYIMGTILWTAFVYLTGNFATLFTTGVNQANLNWMYVHNAVGPDLHPGGPGASPTTSSRKSSNTPLLQPQAVDDRLLVAGLRLCLDRRAPHAPRADLAVAADHRHHLLA